jgi:hypothetical protein
VLYRRRQRACPGWGQVGAHRGGVDGGREAVVVAIVLGGRGAGR